jgi:outer membrane protein assembly factor BamB
VYAVDARTDATIWTAAPTLSTIIASPTVSGGTVNLGPNDGRLLALNASNGHQLWSASTGATIYSSAAVADGSNSGVDDLDRRHRMVVTRGRKWRGQRRLARRPQGVRPG